ncbi:MAG: segregation/condensation protein A [Patescibacteria group bacterium]
MPYIVQARKIQNSEENVFEGPMDLLLELILKNKLDITDISLSQVADQFIDYMQENSDLIGPEQLSEFLLIAGKLVLIKSRAILPLLELEKEEEEDIEELKRRLREYKRFKDIFPHIRTLYERREKFYDKPGYVGVGTIFCPPGNLKLEDLEGLFAQAITKMPVKEDVGEKKQIVKISISDKISEIKRKIFDRALVTFRSLIAGNQNKMEVVVTFLAMLELVRKNQAVVDQEELFGEISIKKI